MRKKVLVCGATGFLGRNIVETLAQMDEYEVTGTYFHKPPYLHPGINWVRANLTDRATVHELLAGKEIVLHYAAIVTNFNDPTTRDHATDNLIMSALLIKEAHEQKVSHFVFPSCGYLYNSSETPFREEDVDYNNLPENYFLMTWTKVHCEKMCEFYSTQGTTKYTVLRQANIYGMHDKTDLNTAHSTASILIKVAHAKSGSIEVWGDGAQKKDLLFVSDLTALLASLLRAKRDAFDFVNAGSGEFVTIKEIAESAVRASGKDLQIKYDVSKPSTSARWKLDCSRAKRKFGWEPRVGLAEGLRKTYDWYRSLE